MKKYILIILFFLPANLNSLELSCRFEEVYKDGLTQQGFFLIKEEKFRYEYLDKNLFTIIIKDNKYYLIPNNQKDSFSILDENTELIDDLSSVLLDFPNINEVYEIREYTYLIEKSSNDFIKRIAIKSKEINMSINFLNCQFKDIHDKFFMHFPIMPYKL